MNYTTLIFTIDGKRTSIRLEDELLNAYSLAGFKREYKDNKKSTNKVIRTLIKANYKDYQAQITQNIRRVMLEYISEHLQEKCI